MDKDPGVNISDIVDTLEEDTTLEETDFNEEYNSEPRSSGHLVKILFIGGAIVLVIIIFALFPSGESDFSKTDFNALIERVNRIEARVNEIKEIEERIAALLQAQQDTLRKSLTATVGTESRVQTEKVRYHVVVHGENLSLIASKYGLTLNKLCNLNKITPRKPIYPGQKLLVSIVHQ